jgi:hypothetical protein
MITVCTFLCSLYFYHNGMDNIKVFVAAVYKFIFH